MMEMYGHSLMGAGWGVSTGDAGKFKPKETCRVPFDYEPKAHGHLQDGSEGDGARSQRCID